MYLSPERKRNVKIVDFASLYRSAAFPSSGHVLTFPLLAWAEREPLAVKRVASYCMATPATFYTQFRNLIDDGMLAPMGVEGSGKSGPPTFLHTLGQDGKRALQLFRAGQGAANAICPQQQPWELYKTFRDKYRGVKFTSLALLDVIDRGIAAPIDIQRCIDISKDHFFHMILISKRAAWVEREGRGSYCLTGSGKEILRLSRSV